jgi:hypothetical protein
MKRAALFGTLALGLAAVFVAWLDPSLMQTASDVIRACF